MGIPRTGSQGLSRDLWALSQAACYEPDPQQGHAQTPPAEIQERFDTLDVEWVQGATVPFSPQCKKCRQTGKRVMERRGLDREQVKRCFEVLGAKWEWTSRESDAKRRDSDRGEMVIDQNGVLTTDTNVKARQRKAQRRIEHKDRHGGQEAAKPSAATTRESHRIDKMWD